MLIQLYTMDEEAQGAFELISEVGERVEDRGPSEATEQDGGAEARVKLHPLNSSRLTLDVYNAVARQMGLPPSETREGTLQQIEESLREEDYEPLSIQVRVTKKEGYYPMVELLDAAGVMLRVDVFPEDREPGAQDRADGDGRPDRARNQTDLEAQLQEAETQNKRLTTEVSKLEEDLGRAQERIRELWDLQCRQVREADCQLAAAEAEIAQLKAQLAGRSPSPAPSSRVASVASTPSSRPPPRRGKAPPVESFSGEDDS